ncbi:hypothetical protein KsCSTR_43760 [Candidatus Kuenenia stuttgartiensis]|uniref:Uncharacterized protein n=1 Tax=Kuenenia stuttgartiensis TaxID=174633 RepID=Q1PX02_KUEST|nr:hypothetical protein KsCSTR_43760 [Candidatus Kuenenia stuttgartiensis]CAJ71761.1 unknown protein [Candidatus Kuenenia stuttgartiensis]
MNGNSRNDRLLLNGIIENPQSSICGLPITEGTIKYFPKKHALTNGSVRRNY